MGRSRFHWYTPFWGRVAFGSVDPLDPSTWGITAELVNPDPGAVDDLLEASVRVTRIVGQYAWDFGGVTELGSTPMFMHHRVYPVSGDGTSVFSRDLDNVQDADSDFMWHHIEGVNVRMGGIPAAEQQRATSMVPTQQAMVNVASRDVAISPVSDPVHARRGHVDIKVDRRIDEGEMLVWQTSPGTGDPSITALPWQNAGAGVISFGLFLWVRLLIKVDV